MPAHSPPPRHSTSAGVLEWLIAHRQLLGGCAAAAVASYLGYKAYRSESAANLARLGTTLRQYAAAAANLSGTASVLAADLQAFLASDADELPRSLRQLNKLLQSPELQATVTATATSLAQAVQTSVVPAAGCGSSRGLDDSAAPSALQTVLDALLSDRGHSLVGMAVGLATKNATTAFCDFLERMQHALQPGISVAEPSNNSSLGTLVNVLGSEQGERLVSLVITKSIRTAVHTYVDATTGYNVYQDMVASITNQVGRVCLLVSVTVAGTRGQEGV
jgi:hypothetical protein